MATLDTTAQLTLLELANRIDPKGDLAVIAEVLDKTNAMLKDAPWVEANGTFTHKYTRRLSEPAGSWRRINEGVAKEASMTQPVTDVMGFLESYSEVDKALVDNAPNPKAFRMIEARAFLKGMAKTLATAILYSNVNTDPEKIHGLAPRLNDLSLTNVVDSGGTGTNSIYIVQWGEDKVHMFYPKDNKTMGIEHTDLGEVTLTDASSNLYQGYRDHFQVHCGLAVHDERCIARYPNISSTGTFYEDYLIELVNSLPDDGAGAVMYCNRYVMTRMQIKLKDKDNVNFTPGDGLSGGPVLYFQGIPIRKMEAALSTESVVT